MRSRAPRSLCTERVRGPDFHLSLCSIRNDDELGELRPRIKGAASPRLEESLKLLRFYFFVFQLDLFAGFQDTAAVLEYLCEDEETIAKVCVESRLP